MAAIGVALWKYVMKYAPHSPTCFNRVRFVLSNGHPCLFKYCFLHLTGYNDMTFDQLKSYHPKRTDAIRPGHPEIEHEGIEVTTGPLGQGARMLWVLLWLRSTLEVASIVPALKLVNNHIWCIVGDTCLQEGVGLEAISLAGHWKLDKLTIIYDNNQVTCDGSVDLTDTEDMKNKEVEAFGEKYPNLGAKFRSRVEGKLPPWKHLIPSSFPSTPIPSRKSAGLVFNPIAKDIKSFMVGTADLSPSVNMAWDGKKDFQHVRSHILDTCTPC